MGPSNAAYRLRECPVWRNELAGELAFVGFSASNGRDSGRTAGATGGHRRLCRLPLEAPLPALAATTDGENRRSRRYRFGDWIPVIQPDMRGTGMI